MSNQIQKDPVLIEVMKKIFVWANEMGLNGNKVSSLTFVDPNDVSFDPVLQMCSLWCKIECTEEEEKKFKEIRKLQIENDILN